jgi:hypothetical protein
MSKERQKIEEKIEDLDLHYNKQIILDKLLPIVKDAESRGYRDFYITFSDSDYFGDRATLYGEREENDAEYKKRQEKLRRSRERSRKSRATAKERAEKKERKEYERLKKKFDK